MPSPDEILAEQTVQALIADDIIPDARRDEARQLLSTGAATAQHWRRWAEQALERADREVNSAQN